MNKFIIATESTTDLTPALIAELDIHVMPMKFNVNGKDYENHPDERDMKHKDFYDTLRGGNMSQTAQINPYDFEVFFAPFLEEGLDILYIGFSSALSGTCDGSRFATETLLEKYPARRIITVDSLGASMGEGLLVYEAAKLRDSGADIDTVAAFCEEKKLNLCHWFTVDDLNHLKRGGRVSPVAAMFGTLLGIKPVLHVSDEGKLIPMEKIRGRKQALETLCEKMRDNYDPKISGTVFISHGDSLEDAEFCAEYIKKNFAPERLEIGFIGPVIGSHSGPGTIALFFFGKGRD